jgi:hypothetical protein
MASLKFMFFFVLTLASIGTISLADVTLKAGTEYAEKVQGDYRNKRLFRGNCEAEILFDNRSNKLLVTDSNDSSEVFKIPGGIIKFGKTYFTLSHYIRWRHSGVTHKAYSALTFDLGPNGEIKAKWQLRDLYYDGNGRPPHPGKKFLFKVRTLADCYGTKIN